MSFEITVPGKVFLLGEYAVLSGAPAWVAAVSPRFALREEFGSQFAPHPDSPAGRLSVSKQDLRFDDPLNGAGGLGASTAQFAALYFLNALRQGKNPTASSWQTAWQMLQDCQTPETRGSGADFIAQWIGGISEITLNPESPAVLPLATLWDWSGLLIFSATQRDPARKVATHAHLAELRARGGLPERALSELRAVIDRARTAIQDDVLARGKSPRIVGECLTQYAEILQAHGCEAEQTTADRKTLAQFPGVTGVKGCGALQSDTLVVLWDRAHADAALLPALLSEAKSRGLELLADRFIPERGVTWSYRGDGRGA